MEITKRRIQKLSEQYDTENSGENKKEEKILNSIRGFNLPKEGIPIEILTEIADWKAARVKGYIKNNDPDYVKEVTKVSFATNNEKLKLEVLTLLDGVSIGMSSAILMFCYPDKYTVMDWRAWKSLENLGILKSTIEDTYERYLEYNEACKKIAEENGVYLRVLDKALWQWKGGK